MARMGALNWRPSGSYLATGPDTSMPDMPARTPRELATQSTGVRKKRGQGRARSRFRRSRKY